MGRPLCLGPLRAAHPHTRAVKGPAGRGAARRCVALHVDEAPQPFARHSANTRVGVRVPVTLAVGTRWRAATCRHAATRPA